LKWLEQSGELVVKRHDDLILSNDRQPQGKFERS
jgi:hypothetical protein